MKLARLYASANLIVEVTRKNLEDVAGVGTALGVSEMWVSHVWLVDWALLPAIIDAR